MSMMEELATAIEDHPLYHEQERPNQSGDESWEDSSENESDNESQRESYGEIYDSSKYPNPKNLTGYELKRALRITRNAECLFRSGTLTNEEFDGEVARAWKLNEGAVVPPTKKRKMVSTTKAKKDTTLSIPVRRSKRNVKPVDSFLPPHPPFLRRSTRKVKGKAATETTREINVMEDSSPSKKVATNTESDRGTTSSDLFWSPEEHGLFVEASQRHAKEKNETKKWRKIAMHVETKTAQEVRDYATISMQLNWRQGPSQKAIEKVAKLNVTVNQSGRLGADEMTKMVQSTRSAQSSI